MRTRFLRGNTAANNGLTLPPGELAVDLEKMALRLHADQIPGGFEIIGTQAYTPVGHGPQSLMGGDAQWGFYGEVASADFISGDALATAVGLSAGTSQNSTSDWLKFNANGRIVLIPKLTFRNTVSWENIYQAGAVYGDDTNGLYPAGTARLQDAVVTIDGFDYRVRLLRGASTDPISGTLNGWDIPTTHGSEWNRLLYPVHSGVHTDAQNPTPHTDPNAAAYASWASYSDADLGVDNANIGGRTLCQELHTYQSPSYRVLRGYSGVTRLDIGLITATTDTYGWRPVLELVE